MPFVSIKVTPITQHSKRCLSAEKIKLNLEKKLRKLWYKLTSWLKYAEGKYGRKGKGGFLLRLSFQRKQWIQFQRRWGFAGVRGGGQRASAWAKNGNIPLSIRRNIPGL